MRRFAGRHCGVRGMLAKTVFLVMGWEAAYERPVDPFPKDRHVDIVLDWMKDITSRVAAKELALAGFTM